MTNATVMQEPAQRHCLPIMPVLALIIMLLEPPTGFLSDNQEYYFASAEMSVSSRHRDDTSALFDRSRHRVAAEQVIGHLVTWLGYEGAQKVGAVIHALGWGLALSMLFARLNLGLLAAAAVIVLYHFAGPDLFGGEWLFFGLEPKTLAYPLAVLSIVAFIERRWALPAVWSAIATYFHFHVGAYWFIFGLLGTLWSERDYRNLVRSCVLYAVLVIPQIWLVLQDRWRSNLSQSLGTPTADWIYAVLRGPHHMYPFKARYEFVFDWLPGILTAGILIAIGLFAKRVANRDQAILLNVLIVALGFTLIGVALAASPAGIALGKFYLFRPTSLALLFFIAVTLGVGSTLIGSKYHLIVALGLLVVLPHFGATRFRSLLAEIRAVEPVDYAEIQRLTKAGDVILLDPRIEGRVLNVERKTNRPAYVMWKFAPTEEDDILEWYRRIEQRRMFFNDPCEISIPAITHVLMRTEASDRALHKLQSCAEVVELDQGWRLARLGKPSGR